MITLPTINLNGTTAKQLLEQQLLAIEALRCAITALQGAGPNGRDYQLAPATFSQAQHEHIARLVKLEAVLGELEQIAMHCSDHIR